MSAKKLAVLVLLGFALSLTVMPGSASQKDKKKEEKGEQKIYIPNEVKPVLQQGLQTRQGRQDIPFEIFKHIFLPAAGNSFHNIFLFKIKNADLDYAPVLLAPQKQEEKKEKVEETQAAQQAPTKLQTRFNIFIQFHHLENNQPVQVFKEIYIPAFFEVDSASYDPEKVEIYSTGYPINLPGDYLLAMAITSLDLKKIGTYYYEFSLPDPKNFSKGLETTPIFFVKELKEIPAAETRAEVHKDYFTYSILQIKPSYDNVFAVGENLDIFFFIYGAVPDEQQKFQIEINYEVSKDDQVAIRYEGAAYESPLISQPLPLKQTVLIKSGEEEKKESRDLTAGQYTLTIKVTDKISSLSTTKKVDFEVK